MQSPNHWTTREFPERIFGWDFILDMRFEGYLDEDVYNAAGRSELNIYIWEALAEG